MLIFFGMSEKQKIFRVTVKFIKIIAGDKLPDTEHSLGITVGYRLKVIIGYYGRLSSKTCSIEERR